MTSPPPASLDGRTATPLRWWERAAVAAVIAGTIAILPLVGGTVLLTRPLWLDEICCTFFLIDGSSSPLEVIQRVARGEDYAPPLLHLMLWTTGKVAGGLSPFVIRATSLLCIAVAIYLLYVTLRRRFSQLPSAAGTAAVVSHSLLVAHAFEGRFYGAWILFATLLAWSLGIGDPTVRSRKRDAAQAAASVLLTTIHWFGVISLGLMCVAAALAPRRQSWRSRLRFVAPSIAGCVVLAACLPAVFAHRADAATLDVLWVPAVSMAQLGVMLRVFFLSTLPVLAVVLVLIDALRPEPSAEPSTAATIRAVAGDPSLAALVSLALFPLLLLLVSVVLQPSMLDRYAIVTLLAWAPLVALGVATLRRGGRIVAVLFCAALVATTGKRAIAEKQAFAESVRLNEAAYARALEMQLPVVFASLHAAYPVAGRRRAERRALFLELPDSTIEAMIPQPRFGWLRRHVTLERNIARAHAQLFGFPVIVPQAQLDTTHAFLLVGPDASFPRLYDRFDLFADKVFPNHRGNRLNPNLALFERSGKAP